MSSRDLLAPQPCEGRARRFTRAGVAFGPRFFVLVAIGFAWMIPAFVDTRFVWGMVAWDGLAVFAWLLDLRRVPPPDRLVVRRTWPAPPALSVASPVEIALINESNVPVSARVLDAVARTVRPEPPEVRIDAAPLGEARAQYTIRPMARGLTAIGDAYLRYRSPYGIAERWARAPIAQQVVTYPNLEDARRQSMYLVRSRDVEWARRQTRVRGAGRAFESLREYRDGDELRDVCWTASARRGKLVTRLYDIERSQTVWILIDAGRLMRARIAGLSKLDYGVDAALALSQAALASGDRVGVLAYGRRIEHRLPAARGSAHLKQIIERLALVEEDEWEADHLRAAGRLLTDQKRRSFVVWITDLAETAMTPEVVRAAFHLMGRHLVLVAVIGDPELQAAAARDPESVDQMYETAAAQEVVHRRERLLARLRERGALALETTWRGLSPAIVNAYLEVKRQSRL